MNLELDKIDFWEVEQKFSREGGHIKILYKRFVPHANFRLGGQKRIQDGRG